MQQKSNTKKVSTILIIGGVAVVGITIAGWAIVNFDLLNWEYRIKVEEENISLYSNRPYAPQIIKECKNDVHCTVNAMQTISDIENKQNVTDTFGDLIHLYEQTYPCHETAHHLGMWFNGYVGDVSEALSYAEQVCGGAVFHGVIQNYLVKQKFLGASPEDIDIKSICPKPSGNPYYIDHWQCLHGIGHGLSDSYDYDVLSAVKRCEEFEPGLEQLSCSKGVFMQNEVYHLETGEGDIDEDNIFYPCDAVDSIRAAPCYHYHVTHMLLQNQGKLKATFDDCDKIEPSELVKYCYYGFGRQLSATFGGIIENALLLCESGQNSQYHSLCLKGMLLTTINVNKSTEIGFSFCKALPEKYKEECYDGIGMWLLMLSEKENDDDFRKPECLKSEDDRYYDICMNASLESIVLL